MSNEPAAGAAAFARLRAAMAVEGLTTAEKAVLLVLTIMADPAGLSWPSASTIVRNASVGRRTAFEALARLETLGMVRREQIAGKSTRYRVDPCAGRTSAGTAPNPCASRTRTTRNTQVEEEGFAFSFKKRRAVRIARRWRRPSNPAGLRIGGAVGRLCRHARRADPCQTSAPLDIRGCEEGPRKADRVGGGRTRCRPLARRVSAQRLARRLQAKG